jgi:hypothetical protein
MVVSLLLSDLGVLQWQERVWQLMMEVRLKGFVLLPVSLGLLLLRVVLWIRYSRLLMMNRGWTDRHCVRYPVGIRLLPVG